MPNLAQIVKNNLAGLSAVKTYYVGFSGGLDSTVLLHIMATNFVEHKICAIHVQHNLQAGCENWSKHCQQICKQLNIPLTVLSLKITPHSSLENQARKARYAEFAQIVRKNEVLLLAHHQQDQAETVLLRLFRGSGVLGLSAICKQRQLGLGTILRPLLNVSPQDLRQYANFHNLKWIEDPSNQECKFRRNLIRLQILPKLAQTWGNINTTLSRTAEHATDAQILLDELAEQDLTQVQTPHHLNWLHLPNLDVNGLQQLSFKRQQNVMRYFLRHLTLLPDTKHWHGFTCLLNAQNDATPIWQLTHGKLIRADGKIWWLPNNWTHFTPHNYVWSNVKEPLNLKHNGQVHINGNLDLQATKWQIRYRQGGESIYHPQFGRVKLKRYLNQASIPYFVRDKLPLLYADNLLVAVANISHNWHNWYLSWEIPKVINSNFHNIYN